MLDATQAFDEQSAVLAVGICAFAKLDTTRQVEVIETLHELVRAATAELKIPDAEWRWSAISGGGLWVSASRRAARAAIQVAFAVGGKLKAREANTLELRMGLHAGEIRDAKLGQNTIPWGPGLDDAARVMEIARPTQVLATDEYLAHFVGAERLTAFALGQAYPRTVSGGNRVRVRNVSLNEQGLSVEDANDTRWLPVSRLWRQLVDDFKVFAEDAIQSGSLFPALAAAKLLHAFGAGTWVAEFCERVTTATAKQQPRHWLFGNMTPEVLYKVLEFATPQRLAPGSVLCEYNEPADSCFLPIAGRLSVELPADPSLRIITNETIVGEFGLWVPGCRRTAQVVAATECLVLRFDYADFHDILVHAPELDAAVRAGIKSKIINTLCSSPKFFPLDGDRSAILEVTAECNDYRPGDELDLKTNTYFLFSGRVRLNARGDGKPLLLTATSNFTAVRAIGLQHPDGTTDGPTATVMKPSVLMHLPTAVLSRWQNDPKFIAAWSHLAAERQKEWAANDVHRSGK